MGKVALIVVDVQRDFCAGGTLAASDTPSLLEPLQDCIGAARRMGAVIVFTQDWHPANHCSFKPNGGPWPVHCVANTPGAELMPPLRAAAGDVMIHKGVTVDGPGYSGFDATGLLEQLRRLQIEHVGIAGIATEYCVRATALDAVKAGFNTAVLTEMIRAVQVGETEKILAELEKAGVERVASAKWMKRLT